MPMHFFDPTVDWPLELLQEEIPDLLYLKANDPLNLSIQLHFPHSLTHLSLSSPWVEYRSLDNTQSVAMLFIDHAAVESNAGAEREIQTLLHHLRTQDVEVGRYRKVETTFRRRSSPTGPAAYMWSWAFRPLAPQQLRSCLTVFETYAAQMPVFRAQQETTTYRLLPGGRTAHTAPNAAAALIVHHMKASQEIAEQQRFTQELLQGHTIVEKTILGISPGVQFNDLPGGPWHSPVGMVHPGQM